MGIPQPNPTVIYEDNIGCKSMTENIGRRRTKHIDVRFHFVRELVEGKVVKVKYCPTTDMTADIFTKPLPAPQFCKFRDQLGVQPID